MTQLTGAIGYYSLLAMTVNALRTGGGAGCGGAEGVTL